MTVRRSAADAPPLTLEQYEELPEEAAYRLELVEGRLVREPRPAPLHARVLTRLAYLLEDYVRRHDRGVVLADAGFVLSRDPDTVRVPDLSFVLHERVPEDGFAQGFWHFAPDLAVEVLSPSNRASEIDQKVLEYFGGGARRVWIVDPRLRTVRVHETVTDARMLVGDSVLDGGDVLPGFRASLGEIFRL